MFDSYKRHSKIKKQNYNINLYQTYIYSSIELRILSIYGLVLYRYQKDEEYLEIMKFIAFYNFKRSLYSKPPLVEGLYNLSVAYYRLNNFKNSLVLIKKVLSLSLYEKNTRLVIKCYHHMVLIYYYEDKDKSISYLKKSLNLCELMNFRDLKLPY